MTSNLIVTLRDAALPSVQTAPDPQTGHRRNDPLRDLLPDRMFLTDPYAHGRASWAVEQITGEEEPVTAPDPTAWLRATLRRWAVRQEQNA